MFVNRLKLKINKIQALQEQESKSESEQKQRIKEIIISQPEFRFLIFNGKKREIGEQLILQQKIQRLQALQEDKSILYLQIDDLTQRKAYVPNRSLDEKKKAVHWGQRKLLLTEVFFLSKYGHLSKNVLYVGAAGGNHIPYLGSLFPNHVFYLVDPQPFNIKESEQIKKIYNEYCTKEFLSKWMKDILQVNEEDQNNQTRDVLFISDIRTANFRIETKQQVEYSVLADNEFQREWTIQLRPQKAMLKFRCPYPDIFPEKSIKMLRGDILLQAWAPSNSTETRLITDGYQEIVEYDNLNYEQAMVFENLVKRVQKDYYKPPVNLSDRHKVGERGVEIHGRFDEAHEILIWVEYLTNQRQLKVLDEFFFQTIEEMSNSLTENLIKLGCKRRLCREIFKDHADNPEYTKVDHGKFRKSELTQIKKVDIIQAWNNNNNNAQLQNQVKITDQE